MLIAAAREMIAANRQLKAGLRYSRVASVLAYGGVVLIAVLLIIRGDR
jgi:tetrahydromethanopterin S-methyltransferase subunit F